MDNNIKEATLTSTSGSTDSLPKEPRCAKINYRVRSFYSKGAFLVLWWVLLCTITAATTIRTGYVIQHIATSTPSWLIVIPVLFSLLLVVPLGWLAYTRVGVYKTFAVGVALLSVSTLLYSVLTLFLKFDFAKTQWSGSIIITVIESFLFIGIAAFFVTILQLGLDQMPDASSSSVTSFITWFLFCVVTGIWVSDIFFHTYKICFNNFTFPINSIQLWTLLPVSCMMIALVLKFLLAKNWLIIEPASSQSIKLLYQVLKFAAKHKAPLNRSALTYWEEGIPSRMDLGKSRYGGPFTTEQVEDVKTVLRLFVLSLPLFVVSLGFNIGPMHDGFPFQLSSLPDCNAYMMYAFTFNSHWCYLVTTLIFEFVIYPSIGHRLPSILQRIGIVSFVGSVVSVFLVLLEVFYHFHKPTGNVIQWMKFATFFPLRGILMFFLFCAIVELVYAQAPYNMRGSFAGYMIICVGGPFEIGNTVSSNYFKLCNQCDNIYLILFGIKAAISVIGFILYCALAHWYKKRVRDEDYYAQSVVEEIYDRYLTNRDVGCIT